MVRFTNDPRLLATLIILHFHVVQKPLQTLHHSEVAEFQPDLLLYHIEHPEEDAIPAYCCNARMDGAASFKNLIMTLDNLRTTDEVVLVNSSYGRDRL